MLTFGGQCLDICKADALRLVTEIVVKNREEVFINIRQLVALAD